MMAGHAGQARCPSYLHNVSSRLAGVDRFGYTVTRMSPSVFSIIASVRNRAGLAWRFAALMRSTLAPRRSRCSVSPGHRGLARTRARMDSIAFGLGFGSAVPTSTPTSPHHYHGNDSHLGFYSEAKHGSHL